MKWSPLNLYMLPIIAIQTQKAIEQFQSLTSKVSKYGKLEDIEQLNECRQSIEKRIKVLDRFYQRKYQDETISLFHMLKLKLLRCIYRTDHIDNHSTSSQILFNLLNNNNDDTRHRQQAVVQKKHKIHDGSVKTINIQTNSKNNANSKSRNEVTLEKKKEYEMQKQFIFSDQLKGSSIIQHDHGYDDGSYQDYEPLFVNDPKPIVHNNGSKSKSKSKNKSKSKTDIKKSASTFQYKKNPIKSNKFNSEIKQSNNTTNRTNKHSKTLLQNSSYIDKNKSMKTISQNSIKKQGQIIEKKDQKVKKKGLQTNSNNRLSIRSKQKTLTAKESKMIRKKVQNEQKLRTQERPSQQNIILIEDSELQKNQGSEFRFTIKMTKEQYRNLLQMREKLLHHGPKS